MSRSDIEYTHETIAEAFRLACEVQPNAYAPYSKFQVGAAVVTRRGQIFTGINLETAIYDTSHAEELAQAVMVMNGDRSPGLVVAVGAHEGEQPKVVTPCGKCRQKLWEFASLNGAEYLVVTAQLPDGTFELTSLTDLFPRPFGPADVGVDLEKYRR